MEIILLLIVYFISGLTIGTIIFYFIGSSIIDKRDDYIDDLREAVKIHNKRELMLIFINQSIKDYVKEQIKMIKTEHGDVKIKDAGNEDFMYAANYIAWKDIEKKIKQFEEDAYRLSEEQNN